MMSWEALRTLAAVSSSLIALVTVLLAMRAVRMSRGKELQDAIASKASGATVQELTHRVESVTATLGAVDTRLAVLDGRIASVPTHGDLKRIDEHLSSLGRQVSALDERGEITLTTVRSIQNYLLERKS